MRFETIPLLADMPVKTGGPWGKWHLDRKHQELYHVDTPAYRLDVEDMRTTSAACLDRIMQTTCKVWYSREDAGYLIEAIRELVNPQANLCSWGVERGKPRAERQRARARKARAAV